MQDDQIILEELESTGEDDIWSEEKIRSALEAVCRRKERQTEKVRAMFKQLGVEWTEKDEGKKGTAIKNVNDRVLP